MTAHFVLGDTRDVTATLPDGCIDLVLTSPPFLALRSYLPADHPDKGREIGSEANPAAFLDVLLGLTAEWGRVLAPHGSICLELGDTYAGTNARSALGSESADDGRQNTGRTQDANLLQHRATRGKGWPLAKSLTLVPELFRVALAYGVNPLTGAPSPAGRWRVRNVVRWHRPNPPVGALGDKFRPATTDMVVATRARDRWFDLDAVRQPYSENSHARTAAGVGPQPNVHKTSPDGNRDTLAVVNNSGAGAPPLDTWTIPTHPYPGQHYATWPPKLCEIPVESMVPREVCRRCGTPRRRITSDPEYVGGGASPGRGKATKDDTNVSDWSLRAEHRGTGVTRVTNTFGWSDCGCDTPDYQPGVVLDPFAGTGTTLAVATGHGRHALGIDLDPRNLDLARERVGMFLTDGDTLPCWLERGSGS